MDRSAEPGDVMLIDEVARAVKATLKQIRRLEQRGAFPIPRRPKLDRHPRLCPAIGRALRFGRSAADHDPSSPNRLKAVGAPSEAASAPFIVH